MVKNCGELIGLYFLRITVTYEVIHFIFIIISVQNDDGVSFIRSSNVSVVRDESERTLFNSLCAFHEGSFSLRRQAKCKVRYLVSDRVLAVEGWNSKFKMIF